MRDYPTVGDESKNRVATHVPSSRWPLASRLALTWWRNPNARGIAEPDPRTVARGRRAPRALASPCPFSRRRTKRERKVVSYLPQIGPMLTRLAALANVWPDPELPLALMRALTEAEARCSWILTDPTWAGRTYERATPLYLPRRSDRDATRFIRAFQEARRFVSFADAQLLRERDDRLRSLLASLRPGASRERQPITRRPDEGRDIGLSPQQPATSEELRALIERIGARFFADRPRDAM